MRRRRYTDDRKHAWTTSNRRIDEDAHETLRKLGLICLDLQVRRNALHKTLAPRQCSRRNLDLGTLLRMVFPSSLRPTDHRNPQALAELTDRRLYCCASLREEPGWRQAPLEDGCQSFNQSGVRRPGTERERVASGPPNGSQGRCYEEGEPRGGAVTNESHNRGPYPRAPRRGAESVTSGVSESG